MLNSFADFLMTVLLKHKNIWPYMCTCKFDFTLLQFHLSFSKSEFDLLQKYPRIYQKFQPHVTSTLFRFGKLNEERTIILKNKKSRYKVLSESLTVFWRY